MMLLRARPGFLTHAAPLIALLAALLAHAAPSSLHAQQLEPNRYISSIGGLEDPAPSALLEAALYFSVGGAAMDSPRTAASREAIASAMAEARELADAEPDAYKRGEAVLALTHARFLRRYGEFDTTLDVAAIEGRYNCVSSAVLFLLLSREAGLDSRGVETDDHAFCVVRLPDGKTVDVETTNSHGWDPGSKKEFQDSFGKTTGYSYVPPTNYAARTEINGRALACLIARNRATILVRQGKWLDSLALAADGYAYWPSEESLAHLLDRLNNYVVELARKENWQGALSILEEAERLYGKRPKLESLLGTTRMAILNSVLRQGDAERSLAALQEAERAGLLSAKERSDMLTYVFTKKAESDRKTGGWFAAWSTLSQSAGRYPDVQPLAKAAEQARLNWTYDVHNKFASLYNAKKFSEAIAVLDAALAILPAEKLFQDDKKTALAAIKQ